ncbi:hypothetical protein QUF64_12180 [Anaerolineales bacterium HSG6]|nr:hypothetical protein [Anaerolineales bacterium HSG6]
MPYLEYKTRDGGSILVEVDKNEVQAKSQTDQQTCDCGRNIRVSSWLF